MLSTSDTVFIRELSKNCLQELHLGKTRKIDWRSPRALHRVFSSAETSDWDDDDCSDIVRGNKSESTHRSLTIKMPISLVHK